MKKWSAVFAAAALVVTLVLAGSASATMVVYDTFGGSALDTTLWTVNPGTTAAYGVSGGDLSLTLSSAASGFGVMATRSITGSSPFAAEVDFSIGSRNVPIGSIVHLEMSLSDGSHNVFVGWAQANRYSFGGMVVRGTVFAAGKDDPTSIDMTSVTSGTLGLKYNAGSVEVGYRDGGTWTVLDTLTLSSSGPLWFSLRAQVEGTTGAALAAAVQEVRFSAVPIPGALFLLAPGLAGLALVRKRFKK